MKIGTDEKRRKYRGFLCGCAAVGTMALMIAGYWFCYAKVPSQIRVRAGIEQTLDFGIPVTGKFTKGISDEEAVAVSEQADSNVPKESIRMDLNQSVTIKTKQPDTYQLQLKLFGILPLKEVEVQVIRSQKLIPAGIPIGIYVKTRGVLVIGIGDFKTREGTNCAPCKYLLQSGDYILAVNGVPVESKNRFMETVEKSSGQELILSVLRNQDEFEIKALPRQNENGEYKLGIWIRDNAQGIGTLTYMTQENEFGALGHGINDIDTSALLALESGKLYDTDIIAIKKGERGLPGEMTGLIEYSDEHILGNITENYVAGIYGIAEGKLKEKIKGEAIPIGLKQEIKLGPAQIMCSVENGPTYYDIEIQELNLDNDNVNRGIVLKITDPYLLETTGGIIQGMSGAPIIQEGKIVGAVTHVLVQDSTKGYGIFIENMLEH